MRWSPWACTRARAILYHPPAVPCVTCRRQSHVLIGTRIGDELAVLRQPVEMHSNVGRFGRGMGERDGLIEGDTGFPRAPQLHQKSTLEPEKMEIAPELR